MTINENITKVDIVEEMEQSYIDYAMSVITDRALPDVRDGLKPVHLRILFAMSELGLTNNKSFKKSARVVGDTIGKYHPHGDSSVYDAMVRMAQDFSMRYPLVEGQGNFGTVDGDPAAAMRYTEARMSKIASEMLRDLGKDTVQFKPNFSEDEMEPVVLPSRIPNLLLNGTTGIAVGMACSFPPHQINDTIDMIIKYIEDNDMSIEDMVSILKGPDFATGGTIINQNELLDGYKTGRGRVRLRGNYEVEKAGKSRENLIFTAIPYGVNKEKLIEDIAKLCEAKIVDGISDLRDESNKKGIRIVVELKKDANPDVVANILFSKTQLENTFSMNFTCLVDGEPKVLNLKSIVDEYVKHQQEVIRNRSQYDLSKIEARLHILEGLLKALEDIDNIIALIKGSKNTTEARANLQTKYNFSEIQAKSIVDMRLGKLTGLETVEINNELKQLVLESDELKKILTFSEELNKVLIAELMEIKAKYGDTRRTTITQISVKKEEKEIQFVQPENVVVVITKGGNIKKIPAASFKVQKSKGKGVKNQDDIVMDVISTNTIDTLMVFTNFGKVYRLLVDSVPTGTNASRGVAIKTLIDMEKSEQPKAITSLYRETDAKYVVFVTKSGMIKKTRLEEYLNTKRSGIVGLKLKDGDSICDITFLSDEQLLLISKNGMSIRFGTDKIGAVGRVAIGVVGMSLAEGDKVVSALPINKLTDDVAIFTSRGIAKRTAIEDYPLQNRAGKGTITYKPTQTTGFVVGAALVDDSDTVLLAGDKNTICIPTTEIPKLNKIAVGNIMMKDNEVVSIVKI